MPPQSLGCQTLRTDIFLEYEIFLSKKVSYMASFPISLLAWPIDSLPQKVVGEKQTVALVVQLVVTILNMITEIAHELAYS